ncbi:MAG: NlpC/P60 family protein [Syntrophomonadaceae bacterium]
MKNNKRSPIIPVLLFCWTLLAVGLYHSNAGNHADPAEISASSSDPSGQSSSISPDILSNQDSISSLQPGDTTEAAPPEPALASAPASYNYTVQSGDTLWDIARIHHTTVEQLQALNHLNSDALSLGQTLIVTGQADKAIQIAERPTPAPSRSGQTSRAGTVLQYAARFLNTPYKYGGTTPAGFDCSGFTQYVYKHVGVSLPRTAAAQASNGARVDKASLMPGDLVFFATDGAGIDHVGIYAGSGRFIHSSSPTSGGVIYTSLKESFYAKTYAGARRVSN